MPEDSFGGGFAARFDERGAYQADPAVVEPIVAFPERLAGGGAPLELGVGKPGVRSCIATSVPQIRTEVSTRRASTR